MARAVVRGRSKAAVLVVVVVGCVVGSASCGGSAGENSSGDGLETVSHVLWETGISSVDDLAAKTEVVVVATPTANEERVIRDLGRSQVAVTEFEIRSVLLGDSVTPGETILVGRFIAPEEASIDGGPGVVQPPFTAGEYVLGLRPGDSVDDYWATVGGPASVFPISDSGELSTFPTPGIRSVEDLEDALAALSTPTGDAPSSQTTDGASNFDTVPEQILAELPGPAARFYLGALQYANYDAARSRVVERCRAEWDGREERTRLIGLGILSARRSTHEFPAGDPIRQHDDARQRRQVITFVGLDAELETHWVLDPADGRWRMETCS